MDRYVKVKKIGEGSFGKALLVRSKTDNKQYVVKEVNMTKMSRKEKEEAKKEVKVLSQMHHPNIVSYLESFQETGNMFIVMDYCDGGDLYAKISSQRIPFPEGQILDWFVQLCLAVKHVHDRKILHRDIKSQNIFLTRGGIVKLGDFGIARVLNSTAELARTCIGTPYYLSPEICENRPYNNKSDIWAMGCVLYELATLKHPFEAGNMRNLVLKIIRGSYPPVPTTYSYDLRSLVVKCFKRSPRDRPSVNAILKMTFVQKRIENFLSQSVISDEFSHTVLHRQRAPPPSVAAPPPPQPRSSAPRKVEARPVAPKKSDPASIYGVPMRPVPRKPAVGPKAYAGDGARAAAARLKQKQDQVKKLQLAAIEKKRKEIEERNQKRKDELRRQKEKYDEEVKLQQQQMIERQKLARMQKAKNEAAHQWQKTLAAPEPRPLPPPPPSAPAPPIALIYALPINKPGEKLSSDKEEKSSSPPSRSAMDDRVPHRPQNPIFEQPPKLERAKMVNEFLDRRRAAAANKARAEIQLGKQAEDVAKLQNIGFERKANSKPNAAPSAQAKNEAEREYLARLAAIRRGNFHERKAIAMKVKDREGRRAPREELLGSPFQSRDHPDFDPAARARKIAALKAQADMQADLMRVYLAEKKKIEEEERQQQKKKEPVVPLESALREVGVTRVLDKPLEKVDESESEGAPEVRKQWGVQPSRGGAPLAQQTLEVTASAMEATSADDRVVEVSIQRKKWAEPATPDIAKMHKIDLHKTHTIGPSSGGGGDVEPDSAPKIPVTIAETETEVKTEPQPAKGPVTVEQVLQAVDAPTKPGEQGENAAASSGDDAATDGGKGPSDAVVEDDVTVEDIEDDGNKKESETVDDNQAVLAEPNDEGKQSERSNAKTFDLNNSMSEGLKTGAFDSHTRFLRTCSLPDLRKPFEAELPDDDVLTDGAPVAEPNDDADVVDSNAGEAVDGETPSEEAEIVKEEEEKEEVEEEEENEAMSSDEEDMQEMLATMANVLQERYSSERDDEDDEGKDSCEDTQFGDDDSDREEPELALNESWQSDGDESDKESDAKSDSEDPSSVFHRLELTRQELEQQLGLDKFMRVYRFLQTIQEDGDDQMNVGTETVDEVGKILGDDNATVYPKILKLVTADAAYFEANNASLEEANGIEQD